MALDVIVVGGGLGGSTLAAGLAKEGARVLVLEREARFKDRVRGENMLPWGVAAARRLGVLADLVAAGGHAVRRWITYARGVRMNDRDLPSTTPGGDGVLNMYHPDLQEVLLARAIAAGADVRRGATVVGIDATPGEAPTVAYQQGEERRSARARLVVGADGRTSRVRAWGGFETQRDRDLLVIAGVLLRDTAIPDDAVHLFFGAGIASLVAPLGGGRARTYFVYPGAGARRGLAGAERFPAFLSLCRDAGVPERWLSGAIQAGPLAEFDAAERWVDAPSRNGVTLIGDAAASSDPSWGCGLSLTLLDVEALGNALRSTEDWELATERYAREHDRYAAALRRILAWMTELAWTPGAAADARRARVFPRMFADPTGFPDSIGLGPWGPSDERARRLILGEEPQEAPIPPLAAAPTPQPPTAHA